MKILLDACVPRPLRNFLSAHTVQTAQEMGWGDLKNGDLLKAADSQFEAFLTSDQNLKYQQNSKLRKIAIVVLPLANWPMLKPKAERIVEAIQNAKPGDYIEIMP